MGGVLPLDDPATAARATIFGAGIETGASP